jgi:hypothetical protein
MLTGPPVNGGTIIMVYPKGWNTYLLDSRGSTAMRWQGGEDI